MKIYDHFAKYYDSIMEGTIYDYWKKIVHNTLTNNFIFPPEKILEIGSGTGNLYWPLSKIGFQTFGIDISYNMLTLARKKYLQKSLLIQADMNNLCFKSKSFSAILALFEVLNYIENVNKLEFFLKEVKSLLSYGGLFFADFITEKKIFDFFKNKKFQYQIDENIHTEWLCDYNKCTKIADIEVRFIDSKNPQNNSIEKHKKYIYSKEELENLFLKLELFPYDVLESFTYKSPDNNSSRLLYILKGEP